MNPKLKEKAGAVLPLVTMALVVAALIVGTGRPGRDWITWTVLGLALASVLGLAALKAALIKGFLRSRNARYGGNNAVVMVVSLALTAFIYILVSRRHIRWDLTQNQEHSLSPQTVEILKSLNQDVVFDCFYQPGDFQEMVRDLLKEYQLHTSHLKVNVYDMARARAQAEALQIREYDTTVVQCGAKRQDLPRRDVFATKFEGGRQAPEFRGEQAFTSAILKVTSNEQKKVYVTTKHGEVALTEGGERNLSRLKEGIERETHQIAELSLLTMKEPKVPDDCSLILIPAPSADFRPEEWKALGDYADKNGRFLVFLDPGIKTPPGLVKFLADHGVKAAPGLVLDPSQNLMGDPSNPVAEFGFHKITEALKNSKLPVILLATGALEAAPEAKGYTAEGLIKSSADSWLDSIDSYIAAARAHKMPTYQAGKKKGPLDLAEAVEKGGGEGAPEGMAFRMVVFADVDLAGGGLWDQLPGNSNLVMNSLSWLVGSEKGVTIRPKEPDVRRVPLAEGQVRMLFLITLVLTPLLFAALGLSVYLKRRHL